MSTIILASSGRTFLKNNNIDKYLRRPIEKCKILYIITATKLKEDKSYTYRTQARMKKLKYDYIKYDIEGKTKSDIRQAMEGIDIVYVEGGNTAYLLRCVQKSGFTSVLKEYLGKGVVYYGSSAGTYIACPTIQVSSWSYNFDPNQVTDYTAMNLVPIYVRVHYQDDQLEKWQQKVKELGKPLWLINDNQALLCQNGKVKLLGGGEEIII